MINGRLSRRAATRSHSVTAHQPQSLTSSEIVVTGVGRSISDACAIPAPRSVRTNALAIETADRRIALIAGAVSVRAASITSSPPWLLLLFAVGVLFFARTTLPWFKELIEGGVGGTQLHASGRATYCMPVRDVGETPGRTRLPDGPDDTRSEKKP